MEQFLTPREVADYLAVSLETLRRWRLNQPEALPFTKVGRQVRYSKTGLTAFVKSHQKDVA